MPSTCSFPDEEAGVKLKSIPSLSGSSTLEYSTRSLDDSLCDVYNIICNRLTTCYPAGRAALQSLVTTAEDEAALAHWMAFYNKYLHYLYPERAAASTSHGKTPYRAHLYDPLLRRVCVEPRGTRGNRKMRGSGVVRESRDIEVEIWVSTTS